MVSGSHIWPFWGENFLIPIDQPFWCSLEFMFHAHRDDLTWASIVSQITACSGWQHTKHLSSASVDSPHKGPVMQETFPCHDIILTSPSVCLLCLGWINAAFQGIIRFWLTGSSPGVCGLLEKDFWHMVINHLSSDHTEHTVKSLI